MANDGMTNLENLLSRARGCGMTSKIFNMYLPPYELMDLHILKDCVMIVTINPILTILFS
jgi:hypothetical protein